MTKLFVEFFATSGHYTIIGSFFNLAANPA